MVIQENGNVTLTCHAEGNPKPTISWVREDNKQITLSKRSKGQSIKSLKKFYFIIYESYLLNLFISSLYN